MSERLPISLPEVYRRVNNIEDPVKRAGAQAFAGIYAPTLKLPEYTHSPLTQVTMRHRALSAKAFAINEAENELGLESSIAGELDLKAIEEAAREVGLRGIDLLGISTRARNMLVRSRIQDLPTLAQMPGGQLLALRNSGTTSVKEIQSGLREIRSITTPEEVQARIFNVFAEREAEANRKSEKHKTDIGKTVQEAGQAISAVGARLDDNVLLDSLYSGPDRNFDLEIPQEWSLAISGLTPTQKGAINISLTHATFHYDFKTVGEIRNMPFEQLVQKLGPNRAEFFKNAFGMSVATSSQ